MLPTTTEMVLSMLVCSKLTRETGLPAVVDMLPAMLTLTSNAPLRSGSGVATVSSSGLLPEVAVAHKLLLDIELLFF